MRYLKVLALLAVCLVPVGFAQAQRVVVGIGVGGPAYYGPPPVCAYGYYPYYPYACAPYGYYGPEWFAGGVFIGAGPGFHGYYRRPGHWRDFDDRDHEFWEHRGFRRDFDDHRGFRHDSDGRDFHRHGHDRGHDRDFHEFRGGYGHRGGGEFHGGNRFRGGHR